MSNIHYEVGNILKLNNGLDYTTYRVISVSDNDSTDYNSKFVVVSKDDETKPLVYTFKKAQSLFYVKEDKEINMHFNVGNTLTRKKDGKVGIVSAIDGDYILNPELSYLVVNWKYDAGVNVYNYKKANELFLLHEY